MRQRTRDWKAPSDRAPCVPALKHAFTAVSPDGYGACSFWLGLRRVVRLAYVHLRRPLVEALKKSSASPGARRRTHAHTRTQTHACAHTLTHAHKHTHAQIHTRAREQIGRLTHGRTGRPVLERVADARRMHSRSCSRTQPTSHVGLSGKPAMLYGTAMRR